jgi:type IV pilus assembly protein PilB
MITFVDNMVQDAALRKVSDIHIEPGEYQVRIRFRIDGVLSEYMTVPNKVHQNIVNRIKVVSSLNIAEKRVAQDGRFSRKTEEIDVDIRVSIVPTIFGEKCVLRLLDKGKKDYELGELGLSEKEVEKVMKAVKRPHGIILVCGPTGSGKTTTLYTMLSTIKSPGKNLMTIEDPVEYGMDGINQIQVTPNFGFIIGLKSILRQDPDVIMVGEIRDSETAEIAIRAALTGHLVLSTIHTNNAVGAISRLQEMGIPPYILANTLNCIISQRLVRKACKECSTIHPADKGEKILLGITQDTSLDLLTAEGCPKCLDTGYTGRVACFEILDVDKSIRQLIADSSDESTVQNCAVKNGMDTVDYNCKKRVLNKETTTLEYAKIRLE